MKIQFIPDSALSKIKASNPVKKSGQVYRVSARCICCHEVITSERFDDLSAAISMVMRRAEEKLRLIPGETTLRLEARLEEL